MSYAFASYKVTHKATTGGNKTVQEGHLAWRPAEHDSKRTEDIFHNIVDQIAANYSVSSDAVVIVNFNVMPDTVG